MVVFVDDFAMDELFLLEVVKYVELQCLYVHCDWYYELHEMWYVRVKVMYYNQDHVLFLDGPMDN